MNPEDQNQNTTPTPQTIPTESVPTPTAAPGLGVAPAPADTQGGAPEQATMSQPTAAPADVKSKMPFLIGVGLVVIVLIAAIVFLAL